MCWWPSIIREAMNMQTNEQTARSKAHSSHYSQCCCQLISSLVPCPLPCDGGSSAIGAPAAGRPPAADSCRAPPEGRLEHGGAAPWRHWSRWRGTRTCPRLMVWRWRGGACGRCCRQPLLPPKQDKQSCILVTQIIIISTSLHFPRIIFNILLKSFFCNLDFTLC